MVGRGEGEEYQDTEESVKQTYHHEDTPKLLIKKYISYHSAACLLCCKNNICVCVCVCVIMSYHQVLFDVRVCLSAGVVKFKTFSIRMYLILDHILLVPKDKHVTEISYGTFCMFWVYFYDQSVPYCLQPCSYIMGNLKSPVRQ